MAFTPFTALAGGALIGASASAMLALNGRIAGISGILGGLVRPERGEWTWRLAFVAGLVGCGFVVGIVHPAFAAALPGVPLGLTLVAGLLVGFGTQLGGGCTSGHGVCGISRLSGRSAAATVTFMLTGAVSTYVVQHLLIHAPMGTP
jgi:uncharacterized membrane protein YedE/YeeE